MLLVQLRLLGRSACVSSKGIAGSAGVLQPAVARYRALKKSLPIPGGKSMSLTSAFIGRLLDNNFNVNVLVTSGDELSGEQN